MILNTLSDDDITRFLEITGNDLDLMRTYWQRYAAKPYKTLLDAATDPRNSIQFDIGRGAYGQYVMASGRAVSESRLKAQIEKIIKGIESEMQADTKRLNDGETDPVTWFDAIRQKLKILHGIAVAAVVGGLVYLASNWLSAKGLVRDQIQWLNGFLSAVVSGTQKPGRLKQRIKQYANAARGIFEEVKRWAAETRGASHERRILGIADHCRTQDGLEGCVELADKDWQAINTLPRIGNTPCRNNCHCRFVFGNIINGEVVQIGNSS